MAVDEPSERTRTRAERWFSTFVIEHPWRALVLGLAIFAALAPGLRKVEDEVHYRIWFHENDPSLLQYDEFQEDFGNELAVVLLVHSPSGIFEPESAELVVELTEQMWRLPHVVRVDSLSNFRWTRAVGPEVYVDPMIPDDEELTEALLEERREAALGHELLPGYLVSPDGHTAIVYARLKPFLASDEEHEAVYAAQELVDEYADRGDHEFYLTGDPVMNVTFVEVTEREYEQMLPGMLGLMLVFLLVLFRTLRGVVIPVLTVVLVAASGLAMAGYLGFTMNPLTYFTPQIAIAIIIANAVHILSSYVRALRAGRTNKDAVRAALDDTLVTTFFACVTTAFAFFSFTPSEIVPIRNLGILTGLSLLCGWIFLQLILVPLLLLIPIRARRTGGEAGVGEGGVEKVAPWATALQNHIYRKRALVIAVFTVATVGAAVMGARNTITTDTFGLFPDDYPVSQAVTFNETEVGWSTTVSIVIHSGEPEGVFEPEFLRTVDELQSWLWDEMPVAQLNSFVDILKSMNRALHGGAQDEYRIPDTRPGVAEQHFFYTMNLPQGMDLNDQVTLRNDSLRIALWWPVRLSHEGHAKEEAILAKLDELGLDGYVTGRVQLWNNMGQYTARTMLISMLIAITLVSLTLMVMFRSIGLGLLAIVPNLVPLTMGIGLLSLLGIHLSFQVSAAFAIALGIAVDDTVHFVSSYHVGRRRGLDARAAVARSISIVGPAMLKSTLVLLGAFSLLAFSHFLPLQSLGLLIACVLVAALITDIILMPAILLLRAEWKERGR